MSSPMPTHDPINAINAVPRLTSTVSTYTEAAARYLVALNATVQRTDLSPESKVWLVQEMLGTVFNDLQKVAEMHDAVCEHRGYSSRMGDLAKRFGFPTKQG